jgi:hypothetical protein
MCGSELIRATAGAAPVTSPKAVAIARQAGAARATMSSNTWAFAPADAPA